MEQKFLISIEDYKCGCQILYLILKRKNVSSVTKVVIMLKTVKKKRHISLKLVPEQDNVISVKEIILPKIVNLIHKILKMPK